MVTQAEVVYIDEVLRQCSAANDPDTTTKKDVEDGGEQQVPPPSDSEPPPGASLEFFDPLLHVPPSVLAQEKERQLQYTWAKDSIIVLVPLRLGLDSLNPAYIPGTLLPID